MAKDPKDQFKDWLKDAWKDEPWLLTPARKAIVRRNKILVGDKIAWRNHVEAFEAVIPKDERQSYCVYFDHSTISQADFVDYHFPCDVSFKWVNFSSDVLSFNHATFAGERVSFQEVTFGKGDVIFAQADFGAAIVTFDYCILKGRLSLVGYSGNHEESKLAGRFSMRGVQCHKTVIFLDRQFNYPPDFEGSSFEVPPTVSDMKIGPPEMMTAKKGVAALIGKFAAFKTAKDSKDAARYCKLKAMAIAVEDHEKELEFFAHELRCKRGHVTKGWASLLSSLYELFSNYGRSIKRPFSSLAILFSLFFGAYWILDGIAWYDAAKHSFMTSFPFLKAFGDYEIAACIECLIDPLDVLTPIHTLLSLIFLFLLLLGIRNRFKIK